MTGLYILLGIAFLLLLWFLILYNQLVKTRNHVRESWSNIDTELKRRYNLIPNLVETVKGYAAHEKEVLERVIEARNKAQANNDTPDSQATDENQLVHELRRLIGLVENYPDLKANENYLALQEELVNTEDRIQSARRFYNGNVRDYNNQIEVFPSNIVSNLFNFQKREYFEVDEALQRQNQPIQF